MTHTVTLERSTAKEFDRGERAIMVDGVRWGRTIVHHRGMHGTKHTFKQEGGDVLIENPKAKYPTEIAVRSEKRRFRNQETWKPTEERVLDKARELVESGRLRHPDAVKAEHEQAMEAYRQRCAKDEANKMAAFRKRACDALRVNDESSEIVQRVVAAMEWAQTQ